jgi:hypothetical protein
VFGGVDGYPPRGNTVASVQDYLVHSGNKNVHNATAEIFVNINTAHFCIRRVGIKLVLENPVLVDIDMASLPSVLFARFKNISMRRKGMHLKIGVPDKKISVYKKIKRQQKSFDIFLDLE